MPPPITNFGGNVTFTPRQHYSPRSEAEVLEILRKHRGQQIHGSGSLHAWSEAARSDEIYITLEQLNSVEVARDSGEPIATLGAGCQIKRALAELDKQGLTLPAVGLISEQTIAGSTATGTHGSGRHCLSHYLETVRIAHYGADGEPTITEVSSGNDLAAARCSLGCLGIIVTVTLRPRQQYFIEEYLAVYKNLSDVLAREIEWPLTQFFYLPWRDDFLGQHRRETTSGRSWLAPLYRWHWFLTIDISMHLVIRLLVQSLRSTWGLKTFFRYFALTLVPRHWHVVDRSQDHLIMEHELFQHIEMEVFVRAGELAVALDFLRCAIIEFDGSHGFDDDTRAVLGQFQLLEKLNAPRERYTHHYPVCVRRVEPDETLISPSSGGEEDFYALSLISYARPAERAGFFSFCDFVAPAMTALFHARCHWGKYCPSTPAEIASHYPGLPEFVAACEKFDPERRFANEWQKRAILDKEPRT